MFSGQRNQPEGEETAQLLAAALGDRERLENLLDVLATRQSNGALRCTVDALQDFGKYAVAKGWIASCALQPSDRPHAGPQKAVRTFTDTELELLLSTARGRGLRFWMCLETLAHTGRRINEVLSLEWARLHINADQPHFELPTTKSGRQNLVPLSRHLVTDVLTPENCERLRVEPAKSPKAFTRDPAVFVFPMTYVSVAKQFKRHCAEVGVSYRSFHTFRHTKATNMLTSGAPLQAVSMLLGHENVSTTYNRYHHAVALQYASYLD